MVNAAVPKKHRVAGTFNQTQSKMGNSSLAKKEEARDSAGGDKKAEL